MVRNKIPKLIKKSCPVYNKGFLGEFSQVRLDRFHFQVENVFIKINTNTQAFSQEGL